MPDPTELPASQVEAIRRATARLDVARAEKAVIEEQVVAAEADIMGRQREVAELEARQATARQVEAARVRLATAETARLAVISNARRVDIEIDRTRDGLDIVVEQLDDPVAILDGRLPIALLPIRIETRYVGADLRVRIYPDVLHVDQLERLLTAEEEAWGQAYWRERRLLRSPEDLAALWERSTAGRPAPRAAWIVEQTTPVNPDATGRSEPRFPVLTLRPSGPSRAPRAQLLPGRWLVLGYRRGAQVLRKWSAFVADPLPMGVAPGAPTATPATTSAPPVAEVQDGLAIDAAARWITDYDAAVAAGMAVTVTAADVTGGLGLPIDQLVVVGVDHRRTATEAAAQLESAFQAQRFTSGLGFVAPGAPTNAGDGDDVQPRPPVGDPTTATPAAAVTSAGAMATRALGLPAAGTLSRVHGAAAAVHPLAADLHTVVWEPTLGYFLRQIVAPLASDAQIDQVRDHFRRFVRPGGPLPLVRAGRQPYGLLPVIAPSKSGRDATETMLFRALAALRPLWTRAARNGLQLGDSGDPAADLVALLERTSRSGAFRIREALGPGVQANTEGSKGLAGLQQAVAQMLLTASSVPGRPAIVDITLKGEEAVLPVPLVTGTPLSETAALGPDYVQRTAGRLANRGALASLADDATRAPTLLEALLVHAATLELVRGTTAYVLRHRVVDMPLTVALRDRELLLADDADPSAPVPLARTSRMATPVEIDAEGTAGAGLTMSPMQLAEQPLPQVSGRATLANHLTGQTITELRRVAESRQLGEFRASLDALVGAPTAELHRTTAGALDALSHRFDAWATSLATRRLDALRTATPEGLHVGAFGWVEGLRKSTRPASQGYVHAPSLAHATTAAILRSGHLARSEGTGEALAIDLTSRRVRDALKLLDGLRAGRSLGALLGYRFERALRDRGVDYARYILPTRRRYSLPEGADSRPGDQPVEAIEASNVVDGLRLAELDATARSALLDHVAADAAHRPGLEAELAALADAVDAVGDLLVSESVFQAVVGNTERAAAALDAVDRQSGIPEVSIARTPRTGTGLGHRLLVVLDTGRPPASWNRLVDHRSRAEPRVNAWVARVLGDPTDIVLAAEVLDAAGAVLETVSVTLRDLRMSPLSVVLSAAHGSNEVSQLEERLAEALAAKVTDAAAAGLRALDGPPPGGPAGGTGLGELMATCRDLADLLSSARPAIGRDLVPGTEPVEAIVDLAELTARANTAREALAALTRIDPATRSLTRASIDKALRSAADLGLRGALPRSADRDELREQLVPVVDAAARRLAEVDAAVARATAAHGPSPSVEAKAALQVERIHQILGPDFPVVPRLALPAVLAATLTASASDPALLGGEPLAATEWVLRHSPVRPAVERLWSVLTGAERRGADVGGADFTVAQLPHRPGERWIGLPVPVAGTAPTATTSLVMHRTADGKAATTIGGTVAALLVDQWHERIPNPTETTGIAFHADSPGARPPQSILLAVPPTADAASWSADALVATVREAMLLTRMRTLDLDDLPGVGRFLPALYFAFNLQNDVPSLDVGKIIQSSLGTWPLSTLE